MSIRTILFTLASVFAATAFAQDSLFYTNGNVIVGQVTEIGLDVVKYRTNSDGQPIVIEVSKQDLTKIKLKDGQAYTFTSLPADAPYSTAFLGRKHALSLDVIAPALNHVTVGYEQVLGLRTCLVMKVGYIGLWNDDTNDSEVYSSKGGLFTAGMKFVLPRSVQRAIPSRDAHPMAGWYLRPELMFSSWARTYHYTGYPDPYYHYPSYETKTAYTSAAITLSVGREVFLGEHVTFDVSVGLGYGAQWSEDKSVIKGNNYHDYTQEYAFSHIYFGDPSPLVVTGGLRFGYVF